MTHSALPLLALATLTLHLPVHAQHHGNTPVPQSPSVTHCQHEDAQTCSISNEERRRLNAEARMLEAQAQRLRAETRALEAQRALAREEQRRIQVDRQAALSAAKQQEWKHRSVTVTTDALTGNTHRYHSLVLSSVTGHEPRHTITQVHDCLAQPSDLEFINTLKIKRRLRTQRNLPAGFTSQAGVLTAHIHREPLNEFGRFVRIVVRDHRGSIVYDARFENVHFGEMLAPLQGRPTL